jgi:hypothetical protein
MRLSGKWVRSYVIGLSILFVLLGSHQLTVGQSTTTDTDPVRVDGTRMGCYRALAQLSYRAFKSGDLATAATLATILERTWDRGEGSGHPDAFSKRNAATWEVIDNAMDDFIKPIVAFSKQAPDPVKVKAAYDYYLSKLALAD